MKKLIVLVASRLLPGRSPMKITRRFAVASLLVVAVAVVLGAPAPASAGKTTTTTQYKLSPVTDSPSPHATGTVTEYRREFWVAWPYGVSVSVSRLAPNASYYMPVTMHSYINGEWYVGVFNVHIQTDARGKGVGGLSALNNLDPYSYSYIEYYSQVYDASGTLVLTSSH